MIIFRSSLLLLSLILFALPGFADSRTIAIYLDGAVVEQSITAKKGYLEILLPAAIATDSLRIKPVGTAEINRIVTGPLKSNGGTEKELDSINAKEEMLNDRLKAIAVKEEIFKSAAKSQSGKAPRRTKTNPEPMATIRQGTDYAISQLEAVYQSKRKTEKELAALQERKSVLKKRASSASSVAKVWVSPANAAVAASWIQTDIFWVPEYQLRIDPSGIASMSVYAQSGSVRELAQKSVHFSNFNTPSAQLSLYAGNIPLLNIPFTITSMAEGDQSKPPSLRAVNPSSFTFPQGEVSCFHNGSYKGKGVLPETGPGKSVDISCSSSSLKQ